MNEHVGFEPPELCVCCGEHYQFRNRLCWGCWIDGQEQRGEERSERERLEKIERKEKCD